MNLEQKKVIERIIKDFDSLSKEEIKRTLISMLETESLSFKQLWNSKSDAIWRKYLNHYWGLIKSSNFDLTKELEQIKLSTIKELSPKEWYDFLLDKYFVWKYTAANRYASTTKYFRKYEIEKKLDELLLLRDEIINLKDEAIKYALRKAAEIKGLGIAGASGLLSILFPSKYGTVDQFVVKRLLEIHDLPERKIITKINPESINPSQGAILIEILRRKADELNIQNKTDFWTPRKVDMVLWSYGR
ncbi:hypothetical protein ES705_22909 [subsurface metagenome]